MQQVKVTFGNADTLSFWNDTLPTDDVIDHIAIVQYDDLWTQAGMWSVTHVPTGHAFGDPLPTLEMAQEWRESLFAAFPGTAWEFFASRQRKSRVGRFSASGAVSGAEIYGR